MATEAEKAAFTAAMAEPANLEWAWTALKKVIKEYPEIIKRLNAHVAEGGIAGTMEGLVNNNAATLDHRTSVIKNCLRAALRYKASGGGTRTLANGLPWDDGLKGSAPKGEVEIGIAEPERDDISEAFNMAGDEAQAAEPAEDSDNAVLQALSKALKKGMDPKQVEALIEAKVGPLRRIVELLPDTVGKATQAEVGKVSKELAKLSENIVKLGEEREGCSAKFEIVAKEIMAVTNRLHTLETKPKIEVPKASVDAALRLGVIDVLGDVINGGGINKAEDSTDDKPADGLFHPDVDSTFILRPKTKKLFEYLNTSRQKAIQNVAIVGPHGCGKSTLAIQFAAQYKLPILIMDCANVREPRDWFGYKTVQNGRLLWHESQFDRAIAQGNVVIVLDEIPRCSPHIMNTLFPILDDRRFTFIEEKGARLTVGAGTIFFATMNEGHAYTGNSAVDAALADRFARRVEVDYLPPSDESKVIQKRSGINAEVADKLVDLANTLRNKAVGLNATLTKTISTRQLIAAAQEYEGLGVDGLISTILNHYSADGGKTSEREQVSLAVQGKFGTSK